jgi:hypothetical protein
MRQNQAAEPDIDTLTAALPLGLTPLLAESHEGSSCASGTSPLVVHAPPLPTAGWCQSE